MGVYTRRVKTAISQLSTDSGVITTSVSGNDEIVFVQDIIAYVIIDSVTKVNNTHAYESAMDKDSKKITVIGGLMNNDIVVIN